MTEATPDSIKRTYFALLLLSTLATSFIWGINTLFLLDAGLNNTQAFAANAFFTLGQVLFEVPTGVIADTWGRRTSYLLGSMTLFAGTICYVLLWHLHAPFAWWAIVSVILGLGFTFFSGATEAWLVDALKFTKYKGSLESVFGRGQVVTGIGMFSGAVLGGIIAQATNLGVPFIIRGFFLLATLCGAFILMHDVGFTPRKNKHAWGEVKKVVSASIEHGWRKPSIRYIMLSAPFNFGVLVFAFYALQPYLLELYGDPTAYSVAGLAAAIVAGSQIIGGMLAPVIKRYYHRRTTILIHGLVIAVISLALVGIFQNFEATILLVVVWAMVFAATIPIRQTYLNEQIPSSERATVLSFDNLMGSSGGVVIQPVLGRVADVRGYASSFVVSAFIQLMALPFTLAARRTKSPADEIIPEDENL